MNQSVSVSEVLQMVLKLDIKLVRSSKINQSFNQKC